MKNKEIHIRSVKNGVRVTVFNGKQIRTYRLASIEEAVRLVLPLGNRNTRLLLNGYECVLNGWYL